MRVERHHGEAHAETHDADAQDDNPQRGIQRYAGQDEQGNGYDSKTGECERTRTDLVEQPTADRHANSRA
ncbi:hypothetical protein PGLA_17440 [Paenibacillus glacialis]|uniref:Uncharacterized protein n=1 Tax=Paenibacillus glacialis TaxID=494026 RepID=A0A162PZZ5_9BACL|nr:hypothetical protein PGLA_17440 [Paenibacillus glacialis]